MVQKIDWKQAKKAIDALYTFNESKQSNDLLDSDEESGIYIQITTHKIMNKETTKKKKIALPCKPFKDDLEICYFTKENTKDVEEKVKDTPIKKVINTRELATVYKSFESRRKLLNSYDLFMVDDRIVHLMPPLLGKKFFERNKTPIALKPTGSFKNHIEAALNATYVKLNNGLITLVYIGNFGMSKEDVLKNYKAAVPEIVNICAHEWDQVQMLGLKSSSSPVLPVYAAFPSEATVSKEEKTKEEKTKEKPTKEKQAKEEEKPKEKPAKKEEKPKAKLAKKKLVKKAKKN